MEVDDRPGVFRMPYRFQNFNGSGSERCFPKEPTTASVAQIGDLHLAIFASDAYPVIHIAAILTQCTIAGRLLTYGEKRCVRDGVFEIK